YTGGESGTAYPAAGTPATTAGRPRIADAPRRTGTRRHPGAAGRPGRRDVHDDSGSPGGDRRGPRGGSEMSDIVYDAEDAAGVAEICLAAGCAEAIPRHLRTGVLPEVLQRELATVRTLLRSEAKSARPAATPDAIEKAAAARFGG